MKGKRWFQTLIEATEIISPPLSIIRIPFLRKYLVMKFNIFFDDERGEIEDKIIKLGKIKEDLEQVIDVVDEMESEAKRKKTEIDQLTNQLLKVEEQKKTAEQILKLPKEAFVSLIEDANKKGRNRGIIIGIIISIVAGLIVYFITTIIEFSFNVP